MKDIGILGMPYSGKSTLFAALTRSASAPGRASEAVVEIRDERLEVLARLEGVERVVRARIRFVDVPGGLTAQAIARFREMDALCLLVRAFGYDAHPARELEELQAELLLADLATVEGSLEKTRKRARVAKEARAELDVLERAHSLLVSERPLREAGFEPQAQLALKGYGLLTLKPAVVVANVGEGGELPEGLPADALTVSAGLEAEVAGMEEAEAAELLAGFGIKESGLERVVSACYGALDLVTFLTIGEHETRAWEVPRGATARDAAGVIHSDLQRGFIRAEVISYDELVAAGSWEAAKSKGMLRVEGKDYVVEEGDVLRVRFAV
ncbi:MAG: DUF933 domain-containing protein [Actinomycetota bacterium]|nr:DUF933 domain-containing protein [Actinomycetota bacterium]